MVLKTWIGTLTNTNPTSDNKGEGGNTLTNIVSGIQNAVSSVNKAVETMKNNSGNNTSNIDKSGLNTTKPSNTTNNNNNTKTIDTKDYVVENGNLYKTEKIGGGTYNTLVQDNTVIEAYNQAVKQNVIDNSPKGTSEILSSTIGDTSKSVNTGYVAITLNNDGSIDTSKFGKTGTYQLDLSDENDPLIQKGYAKITYTNDNVNKNLLDAENTYINKSYQSDLERDKFVNGKNYYTGYINLEKDENGNYKDLDKLGAEGTYLIQEVDNDAYSAVGNKGLVKVTITDDSDPAKFMQLGSILEQNTATLNQGVKDATSYGTRLIVGDTEWTFGDSYKQAQARAETLKTAETTKLNGIDVSNAVIDSTIGKDTRLSQIEYASKRSTERVGDLLNSNKDANLSQYYQQVQGDVLESGLTALGVGATLIPIGGLGVKVGTTAGKYVASTLGKKQAQNEIKKSLIENTLKKNGVEYLDAVNLAKIESLTTKPKLVAGDLAYVGKSMAKDLGTNIISNPTKKAGSVVSFMGITGLNKLGSDNTTINGDLDNAITYVSSLNSNPFSKIGGGIVTGVLSIPQFGVNVFKGTQKAVSGDILSLPSASISGTQELVSSAIADPYTFYGEMIGVGLPLKSGSKVAKKPVSATEQKMLKSIQATRLGNVAKQLTKKTQDEYEYALTHGKEDGGNPSDYTRIEKYFEITPKEAGKRRKDIFWSVDKAVNSTKNVDIAPLYLNDLGFSELTISKKLKPETVSEMQYLTAYTKPEFYGTGSGIKFSYGDTLKSYGDMGRLSDDIDSAVRNKSTAITDTLSSEIIDFNINKGFTKFNKDTGGEGLLYEAGHYKDTHVVGKSGSDANYGELEQTAVIGDVYGQMSKTPTYIFSPEHNLLDFSKKDVIGEVYSETPHSDYARKTEGALGLKATNEKHLFKKEQIKSSTIGYGKENITDNLNEKGTKESIAQVEFSNWKDPRNWLMYPIASIKDVGAKINNILPVAREAWNHGDYKMDKYDREFLSDLIDITDTLGLDKTKLPDYNMINDLVTKTNRERIYGDKPLEVLKTKAKRTLNEVGKFKGHSTLTSQLTVRGMSYDAHRAKDSLDLALESAKRGIFDTYLSKHYTDKQRQNYVDSFNAMMKDPLFIDEIHQGFLDKMGTINPKYALLLLHRKVISRKEYDENKTAYDKEIENRYEDKKKHIPDEDDPMLDSKGMTDAEIKQKLNEIKDSTTDGKNTKKSPASDNKPISENIIDSVSTGAVGAGTGITTDPQAKELEYIRKQMLLDNYYNKVNTPVEQPIAEYQPSVKNQQMANMMKGISQSAFNSLGSVVKVEKSSSSVSNVKSFENVFGFEYEIPSSSSGKKYKQQSTMSIALPSLSSIMDIKSASSSKSKSNSSKSSPSASKRGNSSKSSTSNKSSSSRSPYSPSKPSTPSSPYSPSSPYLPNSPYSYEKKRKDSENTNKKKKNSRKSVEKYAVMTHTVKNPLSVFGYDDYVDIETYTPAKGKRVRVNGVITQDFRSKPSVSNMFGIPTKSTRARAGTRTSAKNKAKKNASKKSQMFKIQW